MLVEALLDEQPTESEVATRVATARASHSAVIERYGGGTTVEKLSQRMLLQQHRREAKQAILSRKGRKIDLTSLLRYQRRDGKPLWAFIDPTEPISARNGHYIPSTSRNPDWGYQIIGSRKSLIGLRDHCRLQIPLRRSGGVCIPIGLPALPNAVRTLIKDEKLRQRARFMGVLYQPDEWVQINPDPALIVEWLDEPGVYRALAIWGVDGPQIMEFVE